MATDFESTLTAEFIRECFEDRDGVVFWAARPAHHFLSPQVHQGFLSKYAGKRAGRECGDGYVAIHIRIDGKRRQLQAHRVMWMLHKGVWPTFTIDHWNRTRSDNRIDNLRDVTMAVNLKNSNRATGLPAGVHLFAGRPRASVHIAGETVHLGTFDSVEEASLAHQRAADVARAAVRAGVVSLPVREMS